MSGQQTVHEAAGDWLQRLDDSELSEADIQRWLEWFTEADAHRRAFEELRQLRARLRATPASWRIEMRRKLNLQAPPATRWWTPPRRWALAAGVAVAVLAGLWWRGPHPGGETLYVAAADRHRVVRLDDGSTAALGAGAVLAVSYSGERRSLDVRRGEAYFEVRRDPGRPFMVWAGGVRVTAIGTAFNVLHNSRQVTVTVTEGVVWVDSVPGNGQVVGSPLVASSGETHLAVGQRLVVPLATAADAAPAANADGLSVWHNGRADFINAPLHEVLRVVNQRADTPLDIGDPRVAYLTYSGTIMQAHLDEWIASLPQVYAVRTVPLNDGRLALVMRAQ